MARKKKTAEAPAEQPQAPAAAKKADKTPTFEIPAGDPFVDGAARAYAGDMVNPAHRPLVLRADDPAAMAALKAYRLKANGACDIERTAAADKAIKAFGG